MPDEEGLMEAIKAKFNAAGVDGNIAITKYDQGIVTAFRNCLINHPDGPLVLKTLGEYLHFFEKGMNMIDLMERNIFLEILTMCGIQEDDITNAIIRIARERIHGA